MKVVVMLGSPRKKDSYHVCKMIEERMREQGEVTFEYVHLATMDIKECKGCGLCLKKGEEFCPIKDDINDIKEKLIHADGIIFASPVYACHVTATFKKTVDRLAYLFHRPELIGKPAINVVTTAGGARKVTGKYLKMTACGLGCNLIGTLSIISPMFFKKNDIYSLYNEKYDHKMSKEINKVVDKFYASLVKHQLPRPNFYDIYIFNGLKSKTYMSEADRKFWDEKGWLDSSYYYETRINPVKRLFGYTLSQIIKMIWKRMQNSTAG